MKSVWNVDIPVQSFEEDDCGWSELADKLADKIYRLPEDNSFTVGINGKWGSGKSSFLNLVVSGLEKEKTGGLSEYERTPLIFHFEPWLFSGHEVLAGVFLKELYSLFKKEQLANKADKHLKNVVDILLQYEKAIIATMTVSNTAVGVAVSTGLVGLKSWKKFRDEKKTIYDHKEAVKKALKSSKRQVIVVIDDIDKVNT